MCKELFMRMSTIYVSILFGTRYTSIRTSAATALPYIIIIIIVRWENAQKHTRADIPV